MIRRALCFGVGALILAALASCPSIGNESGTCSTGQTCVCDILGNCEKTCPGGGCHFVCKGTGNCLFDCAGGNCDLTCQNTGNCILTCPGNDCRINCPAGQHNCILRDCQKTCPKDSGPDAPPVDRGADAPWRDAKGDSAKGDATKGDTAKGDAAKGDAAKGDTAKSDTRFDLFAPDGCVPATTCAQLGRNCASVGDGCGGTLTCGTCSTGSCGGGGTTGVCGCTTTATAGPLSPATGANSAAVGSVAWTNPGDILSANAGTGSPPSGVAYAFLYTGHTPTNYLVASGFGLSIPNGALINGIQIEVRRRASLGASNVADSDVRLVSGSTVLTASRASSTPWNAAWAFAPYGGPSDLWGRLWTPADLNATGFGVALSAKWVGASGNDTALVDYVRVTVYYASTCCLAKTCLGEGYNCGPLDDGCGTTLNCGTCGTNDTCVTGKCGCANGVKNGSEADVDCGGICATKCAQGKTCGGASDCASALFCVDGVCCNTACTALCMSCVNAKTGAATGTCANVTFDSDPDLECAQDAVNTCGKTGMCGNGACLLYPSSATCAPATCTAGQATPAKTCDGTGQCTGPATVACAAPYLCNTAGTACQSCTDTAKNGTETDVDCGGAAAACATRCAQGKTCSASSDCAAGLSCADGVCCNTACTGLCMACVNAKTGAATGTCSNITDNSDPDTECPGPKVCVAGACQ